MKSWSKTIPVERPIFDARLKPGPTGSLVQDSQIQEREKRAYMQGKEDGQRELGEQLIHQRAELQGLQVGVLQSLQRAIPDLIRQSEPMLIDLALAVAQ